jgi:hypothetical protein
MMAWLFRGGASVTTNVSPVGTEASVTVEQAPVLEAPKERPLQPMHSISALAPLEEIRELQCKLTTALGDQLAKSVGIETDSIYCRLLMLRLGVQLQDIAARQDVASAVASLSRRVITGQHGPGCHAVCMQTKKAAVHLASVLSIVGEHLFEPPFERDADLAYVKRLAERYTAALYELNGLDELDNGNEISELGQEMELLIHSLTPYVEKQIKMSTAWCQHNNPTKKLNQMLATSELDWLNDKFGDQESALVLLRCKATSKTEATESAEEEDAAESGATSSMTE